MRSHLKERRLKRRKSSGGEGGIEPKRVIGVSGKLSTAILDGSIDEAITDILKALRPEKLRLFIDND